jgi:hypothetical protein
MSPAQHSKFLRQSLLIANLLACAAFCSGCGADGAGSIHIDSPKAKKQTTQTGAGVAPLATAKPSRSGTPQKSVPRSVSINHAPKNG